MEFNRIIKLLRKERGITQKQAAEDLGVSQALLSHYENGSDQRKYQPLRHEKYLCKTDGCLYTR